MNNNGIKDTGENGINGVSVQLFLGGQNPLTATPVATVTTAGGGIYTFNNLSPGQYFLNIPTPPASFPLSSAGTDTADNGQDNDDNGTQTAQGQAVRSPLIALTAGTEPTNDGDSDFNTDLTIDFGFLACPGITVNPATASSATVGSSFSQTFTATGGSSPYVWAVSSGTLPAGLTLNTSTGVVSGTPTSGLSASFTLRATDSLGCTGTRPYTITPACLPITITPASAIQGLAGSAYTQTLTATGGTAPYSAWTVTSGTLPAGLTLNTSTGVISGTPTGSTGAAVNVTVRVTDSNGCQGSQVINIKICPVISISPTTLPNGTVGSPYSQAVTASGGASPYIYSIWSGSLPAGLTLEQSTGIISGTPTGTTGVTFIVSATDANACLTTRSFTVTPAPNTDFGDFSSFASASSTNNGTLRMGAAVDLEAAQTTNASATGDDTTGTDDEDGATVPASITAGASVTLPVVVSNSTGAAASLNAWIDFNNNGSLADAGEQIATNVSIANGASSATQNVTFTVPVGASVGSGRGVRFRLTNIASPGPTGVGGVGEVEDYVVTIAAPTLDFGDFDLFPSASSIGNATLRLGASMDVEGAQTINATATGDDVTGTDDENGVTVPATITQGTASSLTVNVTNTFGSVAYLNAWIDFNGNGVLTDAGEQIATNTTVNTGTSNTNLTVNFTTAALVKVGTAGVRVRLTSIISPGPDGSDGSGEVEDYTTSIVANTDFGDNSILPSASSRANSTLRLGALVDSEGSPVTNAAATGDDLDGSDDEDGVTVPASIAQGAAGSLAVNVTNTSGAAAFLNAWIDFNRNGVLTNAGEQIAVNTSIATGTSNASSTIIFTAPVAASLGTAAVRVRITSVTTPGPDGLDGNGEVEDYVTEIVVPTTDFGDELDFADASSTANNALRLGALVDAEGSSTRNAAASGDDTTGSDDEDALTFPSVTAGQPVSLPVTVTNTTGTAAFLNAWIDYNNNGVLTDAGEQIGTNVSVPTGTSNGTINLDFNIPTNAVTAAASLGTRFRLTSTASPGPTGNVGTGEVEDHPVVILAPLTDFGDHGSYADASNTASSNLRLGLLVDTEYASTRNATATGDDITSNDDEDGVTLPALTAGAPATIPVTVTNATGAIGFLNAWIDFNNNGVFTDSGEQIATNTNIATGSTNLVSNISLTVPPTAVTGTNLGVRVRITALTSPGPSGAGGIGEVEDYVVNIAAPTTDFGDFSTFGSASSTRNATLRLGALTDTEFVATTNVTATGDDTTGSDDEDAIVFPSMTAGAPATIPVLVTNTSGTAANLNLWLDYNGNGVLTDAGEQIATNVSIPTGSNNITQNVSITVPATALTGVNLGARVRLTSTATPGPTGASGNGEVEDYVLIIAAPTTDFGDFSGFGDASQGANPALRLGATLDTEFVSTRNATATGDDTTGTDDEDGLTIPAMTAGQSITIPVTVTNNTGASGFVNVWIDFNNNNVLTDSGEQVATNLTVATGITNGVINVTFTVPPTAVTGVAVGVRVRLSAPSGLGPTGANSLAGEIEDYTVTIAAPTTDFGDFVSFGAASSVQVSTIKLGALTDTEFAATTNAAASGDDTTGSDDEDAVTLPAMTAGQTLTIPVIVTNTTGAAASLNAWIDFNNNGVLTDVGEQVVTNVSVATGSSGVTINPSVTIPATATTAVNLGVRFRLSAVSSPGATGTLASLGEVEDYIVKIAAPTTDFGDFATFGSASSTRNATLRLGALTDTEFVATTNTTATGDDTTGSDDEDGVTMPSLMAGAPATIPVLVTNTSGAPAFLNAWIDYNNNGLLTDAGEQIATNVSIATGSNNITQNLSITVAATAVQGVSLGARFRLTSTSAPGTTGASGNGEVEDYVVTITTPPLDYGDSSVLGSASSNANSNLRLGALVDNEFAPTLNATASGDDITGSDDEDGVTLPIMTAGAPATIPVIVTNTSGAAAFLNAWIDFNNDGDVLDAGEQLATNTNVANATTNGTINLSFTVPTNAVVGANVALRFRLTSTSTPGITGTVGNGEVEDYVTTIAVPTTDFGDWTNAADASSIASSNLRMGALADTEFVSTRNATATGDDVTGSDDEDGVTLAAGYNLGAASSMTVVVTNLSGAVGYLNAWVDWNNNGSFTDAGEQIATNTSLATGMNAQAQAVNFTVPAGAIPGQRGARIRLTNVQNPTPLGAAGTGEVEDHLLTVNCPTITLSPTSLPNGAIAAAYSQTITASGGSGTYVFSVSAGSLPAGLTLSSAGLLSGTPTSSSATSFTIRATDVNGCSGGRVYGMVPACQAINISPTSLSAGTQGTAYSAALSALPAATYSWTIASGSLPAGLSLNATSGTISGTPTSSGTSAFTVRASTGPASVPELEFSTYNLDLNPGDTFNIRNYVRPKDGSNTAIDWSQVSFTYTAAGANDPTTPADWNLTNFNAGLPVTVTSADAAAAGNTGQGQFRVYIVRSGQPQFDDHMEMRVDANRTSAVFSAMNSPLIPAACSATRAYTLRICPVINLGAITTTGTVGSAYSQTITTSAGAAPIVFAVTSGSLPAGLTLNSSTGTISGTPTVEISSTLVISATDANGCAGSRSYILAMSCPPITINPGSLPAGLINTAYSQTLTGSGGTAPYGSWTVTSGTLPAGLTLNLGTGIISGTPTTANGTGSTFTVSTRDAYNCPGTRSYTLIICPVITVNPTTLSQGLVGGPYSETLSASGGAGSYTFAVSSGTLPAGLTLNTASGLISGTPTSTAATSFTIRATDANGCSGTRAYAVTPALPTTDFGDFTLFPSASSAAAATLRLGATVDAEAVPKTDASATGDDLDVSDDEDGATIPVNLTQGALSSFPVTVTNTSGALAYLNVWVDFNRNGSLTDAGEQVLVNSNIATGLSGSVQTVSFSTPVAASLGGAGVRIRLTSILSPGVDGLDGNGEVEDYTTTIVVPTTDFGDDIDFADASSTANASLRLGALVDAEGAATKNAASSGDDLTGSDDEDSLTFPSVTAGQPVTLPVTVTNTTGTAAFLNAWIDYNNNGVLTDAGEQVATNVSVATGLTNSALNLSFTIPTSAVTAASSVGARFRVTSTATPGATGFAGVGEVEDHQVIILAPLTDFGDHSGYADVSNTANSNIRLGLLVDTEYASTRNVTATGDDTSGNDDEDGVTLPAMTAGAPATIPVTVTNTSSAAAYLNAWIDFNNNGVFTDSGEQIATNTNIAIGTVNTVTNLVVSVPAVATTGVNVGVRLRITSDISPGVSGSGGVGEVEDHVVNIAAPTTDFGDLSVFGSASSTRNATLRLGALIDTEFAQTTNATATGDDITGSDDEDAVTFPTLVAGGPATIPVIVTNTSGANAFLNAWIDFNNNGVLTDAGEQVAANVVIATGSSNLTQNLSLTIPATSLTGIGLGVRVRLVSTSGAAPTGAVGNGEVEDYLVNITAPTTDFGDFSGFADASQGVNPALRMGALLDAEFASTRNSTATGDDTTGSDDEDGVVLPAMTAGQTVTIPVTITNGTGANGFLNAWIDFNNNGVLTDSGEQVATNITIATGANNLVSNLSVVVPATATTGVSLGARFRLSAPSGLGPTGANALAGEIEDYTITIAAPTTDFGDFTAFGSASSTANSLIKLGALTDTEFAATTNATATGDDTTGSDDEDSVTFPALTAGGPATIPVLVTNTSGSAVFLNAWIDYNNNGVLTDAGEQIAANVSIATGSNNITQNLSITIPTGTVTGTNLGVRVRLTSVLSPGATGASGNGEVEDYIVSIAAPTTDFGDFSNFASASNSANSTLRMGALVDSEFAATTNATATGDDTTGSDDEDGVTLPAMVAGQTYTIPVVVTNTTGAGAFLNAWIDLNNDGDVLDAGEQFMTNVGIPTGSNGITSNGSLPVPLTAVTGTNVGLRFRVTTVSAPGATGALATTGEVEDYVVNIAAPPTDHGDFAGFAGASSAQAATIRLGALTDTELTPTTNAGATGDDITGSDDEDAVTFPALTAGASVNIPVLVTNTSGAAVFLNAWIDFNNNGVLTDVGEQIATNLSIATGSNNVSQNLSVTVPTTAVTGTNLGARFRLTSLSSPGSTAAVGFGEVEDYVVNIAAPTLDYGDTSVLGSAASTANNNLRLGALVDAEFAPTLNATATGDDITGSDDEDGVTLPMMTAGAPATIPVIVTNTSGAAAFLNAWIDFNNDGDVLDAGEQLATNTNVATGTTNGTVNLSFTVPATAATGSSISLRFRLTSTSTPGITGTVGNGEVEDYVTTIAVPTADFGDWTGAADASSIASSNLRMGALADTEFVSTRNAAASGDDVTGSDDEDGVTLAAGYNLGAASSLTVVVTNLSGALGYLNAWVDWNNNGSFADAGEQIATNTSLATGMNAQAQAVNFTVPAGAIPGQRGARIRLTNVLNPTPVGAAGTGEVEDYLLTVNCPTITLSPASLTTPTVGASYSATVTASGGSGAYNYTVSSGTLPAGLSLASSTGVISGTPTSSTSQTFTLRATDANGCFVSRSYTLIPACPTITVTPANFPVGLAGTSYSQTASASGGQAPHTFSLANGSLPTGLTLNTATGVLSGTPASAGLFTFTIRASDSGGAVSTPSTPNIAPLLTTSFADAVTGTNNFFRGGQWHWFATTSADAHGSDLYERPTVQTYASYPEGYATAGGEYYGNLDITDGITGMDGRYAYFAIRLYSRSKHNADGSTSPEGLNYRYGVRLATNADSRGGILLVTDQPEAKNGTTWGGLGVNVHRDTNADLNINGNGYETVVASDGRIGSGAVTAFSRLSPTSNLTVELAIDYAAYGFTRTQIESLGRVVFEANKGTLDPGNYPWNMEYTGPQAGSPNPGSGGFSEFGTNGLGNVYELDTLNGGPLVLSGVACSGTRAYTLRICPVISLPAISTTLTVGTAYSSSAAASGGASPYVYALTSGTLPAGLSLNTSTGAITGTPTSTTSQTFIVTATDANACTGTRSYTLAPLCPVITVNPASLSAGAAGVAYSQTISATGGTTPYNFTLTTGTLPAGLTLNAGTGLISGTPTSGNAAGVPLTFTATDAYGCTGIRTVTLRICPTITLTAVSSSTTVGSAYSSSSAANGGAAPYVYAVTIGTLPTGLSLNVNTGAITGTPTSTTSQTFTITATDANGCAATRSHTITPVCPIISVTPATLANVLIGTSFSQTLTASNGTAPYTWTVSSGTLPGGLTLSTAGVISGTPTAANGAGATVTFRAQDANGCAGTLAMNVRVCPVITLAALNTTLTVGSSYSSSAAASGGASPYVYALSSGVLPTGLTLNTTTGAVTGTPTSAASQTFTITATDANTCVASRSYTLAPVCPAISITPATLANALIGTAYSQTVTASNGTSPYTWTVSSGTLPSGLTLNTAGVISGTPNAANGAGTSVTLRAQDANGCAGTLSINVRVCPVITLAALNTTLSLGSAYSSSAAASGGASPYVYALSSGVLPTGLTLNTTTGAVTGTPTSAASQTFTITATDANTCVASRAYTLAPVCPTITVNPSSPATGSIGVAYSQTVSATGGTAPYTYAISAGTLPAGLTINAGTGVISGTPTTSNGAGTSLTLLATDSLGCTGTRNVTLKICPAVTLATMTTTGTVGSAYSQSVTASGGAAPYVYAVTSGTLPGGLSLNTSTGAITGTPNVEISSTVTITATDANGCPGTRNYTLAMSCPPITVNPASLPTGLIGSAYTTTTFGAAGGTAPYQYTVITGTLPAGLTLSTAGVLSGTPTASNGAGVSITVQARDAFNCLGVRAYTIKICPVISLAAINTSATTGSPYSSAATASGGASPYVYSVSSGTLPAGLSLNTATGTITGTPTSTTSQTFTITATDANACAGSRSYTLAPVCPTITVAPTSLANGSIGTGYSQTVSASGGTGPYSYAVTSGTLPTGLSLNTTTGAITGTPTSTISQTFTITATSANGCSGTRTYSITPCPVITFNPVTLPNAVIGTAYSQTVTASGSSSGYTYSVSSGALPDWATLNASTGVITGTPTTTTGASFTLLATDALGCTGTRAYTITTVCPTITVNPASLATGYLGVSYNQTLTATGGTAPYSSWTVTSGTLPAGLTLNTSSGVISGTPTATSSSTFTVRTTDFRGCQGSRTYTVIIKGLTLGNLVWQDNDNDGIRDAGEPGVAGAQVSLMSPGSDNAIGGTGTAADVQIGAAVTTPSTGLYSFSDLVPGIYFVRVVPPAAFTHTSGTPATTDNNVDNNNDGSQPGGPGTPLFSPVVTLAVGTESTTDEDTDADTNLTLDFGLWAPLGVGNLVFIDLNGSGSFSFNEGIEGVYVYIFRQGANTATDEPVGIAVSDHKGRYFIDGLNPGTYFLHLPASQFATNAVLSGMIPMTSVVAGDDNSGQNLLSSSTPTSTGASTADFTLAPGAEPTGVAESGFEGLVDDAFIDSNYDFTLDLGLRSPSGTGYPLAERERNTSMTPATTVAATPEPSGNSAAPITFASWIQVHADAEDGDLYPNLLEYALDTNPDDGRSGAGTVTLETTPLGAVDAVFSRPANGRADIRYELETSPDAKTWTQVGVTPKMSIGSDGRQRVRYSSLEAETSQERALFRLKAILDSNLDGKAEQTAYSPTLMFSRETFPVGRRTFSMPLVQTELFAGIITQEDGNILLPEAINLPASTELYVEDLATGNTYEIDETASTGTRLNLETTVPPLTRIALRSHQTLGNLLPADLFAQDDRVLTFDPAVNDFSAIDFTDSGWSRNPVLPKQTGLFVHVRSSEVTVIVTGQISQKAGIKPADTTRLLSSSSVVAESPLSLGLTSDNRFRAAVEPINAARIRFWKGDNDTTQTGYDQLFLSPIMWLRESDTTAQNFTEVRQMEPFRAFFLVP